MNETKRHLERLKKWKLIVTCIDLKFKPTEWKLEKPLRKEDVEALQHFIKLGEAFEKAGDMLLEKKIYIPQRTPYPLAEKYVDDGYNEAIDEVRPILTKIIMEKEFQQRTIDDLSTQNLELQQKIKEIEEEIKRLKGEK